MTITHRLIPPFSSNLTTHRSFSIFYEPPNGNGTIKSLDLALLHDNENNQEFTSICRALEQIIQDVKKRMASDVDGAYVERHFALADADKRGTLDQNEVLALVHKLSVGVTKKNAKALFRKVVHI